MKISIGINIFGSNKRQTLAIECLKILKEKNTNVELYNISYSNELISTEGFVDCPMLTKTSFEYTKNENKTKPIANEFFDILSKTDCDYFLFINSDILLSQKAINLISNGRFDSYIFSRHEIEEIDSIKTPLVPYKIEVAGFDAWAVKKNWWIENGNKIPTCIYSEVAWDNIMSMGLYQNSNATLCNKEFYIAHISHPIKWSRETPEGSFNMKTWLSMPIAPKWDYYMQAVLFRRTPFGKYISPLENEVELEKQILKV